jgi:hypothetical protein
MRGGGFYCGGSRWACAPRRERPKSVEKTQIGPSQLQAAPRTGPAGLLTRQAVDEEARNCHTRRCGRARGFDSPPGGHGKSVIGPALAQRLSISMPPPGLLRADRAHTGLAKKGTYPGEVSARSGYIIYFCRWGGGKDVPASSDSKQQAADTATKQAKAQAASADSVLQFKPPRKAP